MSSYPQLPGPFGPQQPGPSAAGPYGYGSAADHGAPAGRPDTGTHPIPDFAQDPQFTLPKRWRYRPRRTFLQSKALRAGALTTLLTLCGLVILAIVRQQTGTEGFLVGLALAVLPVPLLVAAFLWIGRVEPQPRGHLLFAFAWGACAATLVAIFANGFAAHLLASAFSGTKTQARSWSAMFAAPFIEETCKGAAVLLLFRYRRSHFQGVADGIVIAGITAVGFAFTENVLYLGSAFGKDQLLASNGLPARTLATFLIRVVMSPFAHPLFTCMTGVGFGIAAISRRGQARRRLAPLGGWTAAVILHGTWNASTLGVASFLLIYSVFMLPILVLLGWLAVWSRWNELRTIRTQLPVYASAGWLSPLEPLALSSMSARKMARDLVRHARGKDGARTVQEYASLATSLAFLRARAARGITDPDFAAREQELLHHMWQRKALAQPVLVHAAHLIRRPQTPPQWGPPSPWGPPPQWTPPPGSSPYQGYRPPYGG